LGVSLVLGPGVSSNLLRLLVSLLLLLICCWLLVGRPLGLLWLLVGLLLEGRLLVGWLDRLLGSGLVVGLLSSWLLLLLLVDRGRPLLLNLLEVLEATLLRSSCCRLGPWLLLSHSDHLSCRLWQRVGSGLLQTLLGSLLPLPQLVGGEIPFWVVHILARFHLLR